MELSVAVDLSWGIGYRGSLLQRIPEDMKRFKERTVGKVVVMGRETFESLPGKEPLKDRTNIILSRKMDSADEPLILCHSLDELFCQLKKYQDDLIWIIGGASVYTQLLAFCKEAYVTKIESEYTADKYFVNLDKDETWTLSSLSDPYVYKDVHYKFAKYVNNKVEIY
jgi:dihydrofolate reductase